MSVSWYSWEVWQGGADLPRVFNLQDQALNFLLNQESLAKEAQNFIKDPERAQKIVQEQIMAQLKLVSALTDLVNLLFFFVFSTILLMAGSRISHIGTKLLSIRQE